MPRLIRQASPLAQAAMGAPPRHAASGDADLPQTRIDGQHVADALEVLVRELLRRNRKIRGATVSVLANDDTLVITMGKPQIKDDARTMVGAYTAATLAQLADDYEHHLKSGGVA